MVLQIPLVPKPQLEPLPTGTRSYVPILLDKPGERRAFQHVSARAWDRMTPLIAIARHGEHPTRTALRDKMRRLADAVGAHPFYLDVADIPPCRPIKTSAGPRPTIQVVYEVAERRALSFMPVAGTGDRACRLKIVRAVAAERGQGIAVRHRIGSSVSASGSALHQRLETLLEQLDVGPQDADLILELGYVDPDEQLSAPWLARQIDALGELRWRSVVLAGTSVPKGVAEICKLDSAGERERAEWNLWQDVNGRTQVPVAYGDYGVQNPAPPKSGGRTYANVRYTARDALLVSRGHYANDMTAFDIAAMCRRVTTSRHFEDDPNFSWGDQVIADCASGRTSSLAINDDWEDDPDHPGSDHRFWRAVGTSHHIELVASQLLGEASTK